MLTNCLLILTLQVINPSYCQAFDVMGYLQHDTESCLNLLVPVGCCQEISGIYHMIFTSLESNLKSLKFLACLSIVQNLYMLSSSATCAETDH